MDNTNTLWARERPFDLKESDSNWNEDKLPQDSCGRNQETEKQSVPPTVKFALCLSRQGFTLKGRLGVSRVKLNEFTYWRKQISLYCSIG